MSVAAVQARIAEIQARLGPPPVPVSRSGASFGALLSTAVAETAGVAPAAPAAPTAAPTPAPATAGWSPRPAAVTAAERAAGSGKVEPPAELKAYGNGKIPAGALSEIGDGNHRLWGPAAAAFKQLRTDAAAAGVTFKVTDSYRTYDQQVDLARRKGLYSQGGLAATPGTSNHGWGLSLDLDLDAKAQAWMRENGSRYGFVEDVPREPWHWTFHGSAA